MEEYDFLVIGSGSGLDVANAAANQGQSVAVVEKGRLGGTCLNRGCIPSKMLLYHANVMETIEHADEFKIDATVTGVQFADIVREVNEDVHGSSDSIQRGLSSSDRHELYEAEGQFVDDRTLELSGGDHDGERIRADTVLVAAGTRPAIPPIDGIETVDSLTSTEALQLETPPEHLVIVGGGYIAAELAQFFGTFGSDVSIVGRRPNLLPDADEEVATAFTERYADRFDVYTGYEATDVSEADGSITVEARPYTYGDGGDANSEEPVSVTGDELLVAAGRVPNTDTLNAEAAGIETDEAGFVETDEYLRTTTDRVWALGDIVGEYLLKHNANHEARAVARNLFGDELEPVDYSAMPFAVFASPEVAGVGLTEQELRVSDQEYAKRTYRYEGDGSRERDESGGLRQADHRPRGRDSRLSHHRSRGFEPDPGGRRGNDGWLRNDTGHQGSVHIHPALSEVVQRAFSGQFTRGGGHEHGHGYGHDHDHGHSH